MTTGILSLLSRRELRGVTAHKPAHIKNRDILLSTIAATLAAALSYIGNVGLWAALVGMSRDAEKDGEGNGLLMFFLPLIAATLVHLGISRSREYLTDQTGAESSPAPEALAMA